MDQRHTHFPRKFGVFKALSKWLILSIAFVCFLFMNGRNVQAAVKVDDYATTIDIQNDGTMQQTETIGLDISGTVDQVNHRIQLGEIGKVSDLNIEMRSVGSESFFTFVESESQEVGTYSLSNENNGLDIVVYNTMNAPHVSRITASINDTWTNYSEWSILQHDFLSLPYDVSSAKLTINFPSAVPEDQSDIMLSSPAETEMTWSDDRTSLTIETDKLAADEVVSIQMYMPVSILPENATVGADSEGSGIIQDMQDTREAEVNLQRRLSTQIWLVAGILFVVILAYAIYLYIQKGRIFADVPEVIDSVSTRPSYLKPQSVALLMGKKYSDVQQIILLVLEMVEAKVIAAHFVTNKRGHLTDIQVSPLKSEMSGEPGQLLLTKINTLRQEGHEVVSLNDIIFKQHGKRVNILSRFARKLNRKITRYAKQPLIKEGIYSKMSQVFISVLAVYMVAWLFGTGFVIYWQIQQQSFNILASLLLLLSLLLVYLIQHNVLPMRNQKGVALYRQWQAYLKQLVRQVGQTDVWSNQSNDWIDQKYLDSWIMGSNVKIAKTVGNHPKIVELPLMGAAQPIAHLQLSKIKWQPTVIESEDSEVEKNK